MWRPEGSEDELVSCTIITGEPNDKMAEIHDRMPVMLPPDAWDQWLDPDEQDTDAAGQAPGPGPVVADHRSTR